MKISGIYKIQSLIKPEKVYIGSAINIHIRWNSHLNSLKKNEHHSSKLQHHFNKYGKNDLIFSILIGCAKEDLISTEQFFLDSYKPWFNVKQIADHYIGLSRSEETKNKLRNARLGKPAWNKGMKGVSEETRLKMRLDKLGKKQSPEHITNRVAQVMGRKNTEETKHKMRKPHGPMSAEAILKLKDRIYTDETRIKMSESAILRNKKRNRDPQSGRFMKQLKLIKCA